MKGKKRNTQLLRITKAFYRKSSDELGMLGAFAMTRVIRTLLFGVTPTDVLTFVFVSVILIVVSLIACSAPARRATKVDPLIALRNE